VCVVFPSKKSVFLRERDTTSHFIPTHTHARKDDSSTVSYARIIKFMNILQDITYSQLKEIKSTHYQY
jgi:hypothetical protein